MLTYSFTFVFCRCTCEHIRSHSLSDKRKQTSKQTNKYTWERMYAGTWEVPGNPGVLPAQDFSRAVWGKSQSGDGAGAFW